MNPLHYVERLYGVHEGLIEELKQKACVFLLHARAVVSRTTFPRSRVNFKLDVYDKLFHHFKKKLSVKFLKKILTISTIQRRAKLMMMSWGMSDELKMKSHNLHKNHSPKDRTHLGGCLMSSTNCEGTNGR
jgi:hypothetical protein